MLSVPRQLLRRAADAARHAPPRLHLVQIGDSQLLRSPAMRSRNALPTTESDESLMANAAKSGLIGTPNAG